MKNFKTVGNWWNDRNIEMVEIDNEVYALNGWNGERYLNSWKCTGEDLMDASNEEYEIEPLYKENKDGDFEIVSYEVK